MDAIIIASADQTWQLEIQNYIGGLVRWGDYI